MLIIIVLVVRMTRSTVVSLMRARISGTAGSVVSVSLLAKLSVECICLCHLYSFHEARF
jgi:hypothetical protein